MKMKIETICNCVVYNVDSFRGYTIERIRKMLVLTNSNATFAELTECACSIHARFCK